MGRAIKIFVLGAVLVGVVMSVATLISILAPIVGAVVSVVLVLSLLVHLMNKPIDHDHH